ncbi:MAG TPA: VWA domain-containing protein [Thermoanaerobaculia bacterium]|jgi:VWFA-related protein
MNRLCRRSRPVAGLALALLLTPALPLAAQKPVDRKAAGPETFGEAIDVSVVNVDVFVTDKRGKPIAGLRKEDFEALEDGKPVPISNFTAESGGAPSASALARPAVAGGKAAAPERPIDQQLRLVVFVDDVNLTPRNRTRILQSVGRFLHTGLRPGDQVMLVRYSEELDIRRQFTADLAVLDADIAELLKLRTDIRKYEQSLATAIRSVRYSVLGDTGYGATAEAAISDWAGYEGSTVRGALNAVDSVVSWLAGVPGRKAVLYVSDGLPLVPGLDLFTVYTRAPVSSQNFDRTPEMVAQKFDMTTRFRQTTAHASRNRVVFYPIEAFGTRIDEGTQGLFDDVALVNRQNGLRFLAEDTGGRTLFNATDVPAALARMAVDFENYYSIGYQPQRKGDEAEHKIEVRAKTRGAQVRYRQWYRDKPAGEAVAEATLAVMRFGPEDNPLEATLEVVPGKKAGEMLVRVKVPVSKLYLQPGEGSRQGHLRLYVVAAGAGSTTPVRETRTATVEVPEAEAAAGTQRDYTHEVAIPFKPGSYSVGVGVRDELSATTSYLRRDFTVGTGNGVAKQ